MRSSDFDGVRADGGTASQAIDSAAAIAVELRRNVVMMSVQGELEQSVYERLHEPLREIEAQLHSAVVAALDLERQNHSED